MSEVRYIFGDALTGAVIEEIALQGVSINRSLDGGEFRGSFGLDQSGMDNDLLVSATIPGKCFVVAERNGVVIDGFIIWSRTYQSQAKSVQLYGKTFDAYSTKRTVEDDFDWEDVEQRNVFLDLFQSMQASPYAIQVDLPSDFEVVVPITLSIAGSELRSYRSVMDQVAGTVSGFEWTIDIARSGQYYTRTLRIGYPHLGSPASQDSVVFEYPGAILNYWRNDTIGSGGTNVYGIGAGEGENMGVVEIVHDDLNIGGFPRYDTTVPFKDVENLDLLEDLTMRQAGLLKVPQPIYTVEMKGDREPAFGDWALGDYARLIIKDPLHPEGEEYVTRIIGYAYTPPSGEAVEEVRVTFEGEDDAG